MDADSKLKEILILTLHNAVSRIKELKEPADRRSLFNEYKEWLGENINNEVWALPSDFGHEPRDTF